LKKGQTLEKVSLFGAHFSCEWDGQPNFKFNIDAEVFFIYRRIFRKPDLFGPLAIFDTTPIGRFLRASRSVRGRIKHKSAGIWVPVNGYTFHRASCEI
jgi:hypothetical protein